MELLNVSLLPLSLVVASVASAESTLVDDIDKAGIDALNDERPSRKGPLFVTDNVGDQPITELHVHAKKIVMIQATAGLEPCRCDLNVGVSFVIMIQTRLFL